VYRILAQRFHPDNQDTGNDEMFRLISEAYSVLSDPKKRAAYDVAHQALRTRRWKIFDKPEAAVGVEAERRKRQGILNLLYVQRVQMTGHPWLTLREFEELLGCPREHLEFSLWYLKERDWVKRSDNGRYTITAAGVDEAERSNQILIEPKRLITDGSAQTPAA
jgi:curved DNA-binding protein CbpA